MLDGREEFGVLEAGEIVRAARHEIGAQPQQVGHHGAQACAIDTGLALENVELREVPLELLLHVGAYVTPCRDGEDVEQAAHRRAAAPLALHLVVVQRLVVEEIEAQERAHPLVERLLEDERGGFHHRHCLNLGFLGHRGILRDPGVPRKPRIFQRRIIHGHVAVLAYCFSDKVFAAST
jgi:hypothetical protein